MTDSLEDKNRTYTVIGIALALFLGALDQTIVSTALPRIVSDLGGLDRYTWVVTVYLLTSTLLVPLYGKLSDLMSRKTLEIVSVVVFLVGSVLCGMAGAWGSLPVLGDGMTQLILFRGLQGIGGAGLFTLAFVVISDLYPPRERGKIAGILGAVFGLSSGLGPLIGGFLADNAGWRWVFYVNLPIGAVALWFIFGRMPKLSPQGGGQKLDLVSAALMILAFCVVILALQLDKAQYPWTSPEVLALGCSGVLLLALWIVHSLYFTKNPILELRLFKNGTFTGGVIASFFFGAAFRSILIFLPLYMVMVQGVSATQAGASIIPLTLGLLVGAGLGGPISTRLGKYKAVLAVGSVVSLAGGLLMTLFVPDTPFWLILTAMIVTGVGLGPAQSLYAVAVQNSVPVNELGEATSFSQFSRQIGSTVGSAVAGALFAATLTAAFVSQGGQTTDHVVTLSELRQGPQEIRAAIGIGFDRTLAQVEDLFELRGAEAQAALDRLMASSATPDSLKDKLKNGTPALAIEKAFTKLEADLEAIVRSGDKKALDALFASDEGRPLPDVSRTAISAIVAQAPAAREAAIPKLREQMASGMDKAIEGTNFIAIAKMESLFDDLKTKAADAAIAKVTQAFAPAIVPIWWFNVALLGLLVAATLALPSLVLRGKDETLS